MTKGKSNADLLITTILDGIENLKTEYEKMLFRKNKPSTFRDIKGHKFAGFIKGINDVGNLQVLLEDNILKEFDLKEIKLLY